MQHLDNLMTQTTETGNHKTSQRKRLTSCLPHCHTTNTKSCHNRQICQSLTPEKAFGTHFAL